MAKYALAWSDVGKLSSPKPHRKPPMRIVSGGQSGVDRAALDAAIELGIPHGGWVPNGRAAEDGVIGTKYQMAETPNADSEQRTRWNVRDSDATLILLRGALKGGTELTWHEANARGRPVLIVELQTETPDANIVERVREWLNEIQPQVLNVAGPRESEVSIYIDAKAILMQSLAAPDSVGG